MSELPETSTSELMAVDHPRLVVPLPEHHARYARAWGIYQSDDLSLENYETLEAEMNAAQNLFSWEEFQEFKLTLDGFEEAWAGWRREFLSQHNSEIIRDIPSDASGVLEHDQP